MSRWRVILSKPGKKVFRVFWDQGRYIRETLTAAGWQPLQTLLRPR